MMSERANASPGATHKLSCVLALFFAVASLHCATPSATGADGTSSPNEPTTTRGALPAANASNTPASVIGVPHDEDSSLARDSSFLEAIKQTDLSRFLDGTSLEETRALVRSGKWSEAKKRLEPVHSGLAEYQQIVVSTLLARCNLMLGDMTSAEVFYAHVRKQADPPNQGLVAQYPSDTDAQAARLKMTAHAASLAEAEYFFADKARQRASAAQCKPYNGSGVKQDILNYLNNTLADCLQKRYTRNEAADTAYNRVFSIPPDLAPSWTIASIRRNGELWVYMIDTLDRAPMPEEWKNDPELKHAFVLALDEKTAQFRMVVGGVTEKCLQIATTSKIQNDDVDWCRQTLRSMRR